MMKGESAHIDEQGVLHAEEPRRHIQLHKKPYGGFGVFKNQESDGWEGKWTCTIT